MNTIENLFELLMSCNWLEVLTVLGLILPFLLVLLFNF